MHALAAILAPPSTCCPAACHRIVGSSYNDATIVSFQQVARRTSNAIASLIVAVTVDGVEHNRTVHVDVHAKPASASRHEPLDRVHLDLLE
jgi:hypothetical protein